MDGNRRLAREQNKCTAEGHAAGKEKFFEVVEWVREAKIPHAVFYAFSTENWKREKTEIEALLNLFQETVKILKAGKDRKKIAIRVIGRREDFSEGMQKTIIELEESSVEEADTTIWIALSYGGRAEIIAAVNEAVRLGGEFDERKFSELLWSAGMPDPDLIIRTGGDNRLSNFLPWQSVYSELFFVDTYWPAFTKNEFKRILSDYEARERRIGK